ncbi:MAG: UDP-N-acetylglucosamine--N-acetylmuramyl-(pentapeptide) pyrophosphoryl-undecaprenol N-acetylglucosamine transferase [Dictyoglomus sp. NZ13-RE01]|nr:MAG: UDP-N-acetylglucosamine--N-acetylmuramyl-(pentapeptide) pyrophosphoryl-undecaprenol N-acetylglucosamine transferase [Dictyoglomus sp. NZ13-RE01]
MRNIIFVAGGTGGHLYPAMNLADYIMNNSRDINIIFIGRKNGIESKLLKDKFPFYGISLPRAIELRPWDYIKAFYEVEKIIRKLKPDLFVIFGSYISVPVLINAVFWRYPFYMHEQNVIPGKVIKYFSPLAKGIAISFPETKKFLKNKNIFYTGNFVRKEQLTIDKESCKKELGFNLNKKLLLITGGSQGARKINEIVKKIIPILLDMNWEIFHQIGENLFSEYIKDIPEEWMFKGYRPTPFINEMEKAIRASDLAISRAGATTIYQFLYAGLPAIYIPYPYAKDNHQYLNAKIAVEKGFGTIIKESDLSESVLIEKIVEWGDKKVKPLNLPDGREIFWGILKDYLEGRN